MSNAELPSGDRERSRARILHALPNEELERLLEEMRVESEMLMNVTADNRPIGISVMQADISIAPLLPTEDGAPFSVEIDPDKPFQLTALLPKREIALADGFSMQEICMSGHTEDDELRSIHDQGKILQGVALLSRKNAKLHNIYVPKRIVDHMPQIEGGEIRRDETDLMLEKNESGHETVSQTLIFWRVRSDIAQTLDRGISPVHQPLLHLPEAKQPLAAFRFEIKPRQSQPGATTM